MRRVLLTAVLLPRNAALVLLHLYRRIVSPLYGDVCRYHPSCSGYALQAVQRHGLIRGVALSAWRILRCNPWAAGGVDDVPGVLPDRYRIARGGTVVATTRRAEAPEPPAADTAAAGIAQNRIASA